MSSRSRPGSAAKPTPAEPRTAPEWKEAGNAHYRKGKHVAALECYRTALQLDPEECVYRLNIAAVLLATRDFEACLAECQQVVQHPRCEGLLRCKAYGRMAKACEELRRYEEALRWYCEAAALASDEAAFGAEVQALLAAQLQPRAKALGLEDDLWRDGVVRPTAPMLRLCRAVAEPTEPPSAPPPPATPPPTGAAPDVVALLRPLVLPDQPPTLFAVARSAHYLRWAAATWAAHGGRPADLDQPFPATVDEAPVAWLRQPDAAALFGMHALLMPATLDPNLARRWFDLAQLLRPTSTLAAWGRAACAAALQRPRESFQICVAHLVALFASPAGLRPDDRHTQWLVEALVDAAAQVEEPLLRGPFLHRLLPFVLTPVGLKLTTQVMRTVAGIKTKHATFFEQLMDPFIGLSLCMSIDMAKACVNQAAINRTLVLHRLLKEGRAQQAAGAFAATDVFRAGCILACVAFNTDFALTEVPGFTPACEKDMVETVREVLRIAAAPVGSGAAEAAAAPLTPLLNFVVCHAMFEPLARLQDLNPAVMAYVTAFSARASVDVRSLALPTETAGGVCRELLLLLQLGITEPRQEHAYTAQLQRATDLPAETAHVQDFYDKIAYPKWRAVPNAGMYPTPLADRLRLQFPAMDVSALASGRMLIAGVGSGLQAAAAVKQYEEMAEVVAVDLSARTLCYAHRQVRAVCSEAELQRLRFVQADITRLSSETFGRFGYVECFGCLHHLPDPALGLGCLVDCLAPKGVLALSLYSKAGRLFVDAAHRYLKEKLPALYGEAKVPPSAAVSDDQLREVRQLLVMAPPGHPAHKCTETAELNSLAELRDLLFHPQERRFTLCEVKALLASAGLEIVGLDPSKALLYSKAKLPAVPAVADFDGWQRLEAANPDLFRHMYLVYAQKP
eukprot:EG_transcript_2125